MMMTDGQRIIVGKVDHWIMNAKVMHLGEQGHEERYERSPRTFRHAGPQREKSQDEEQTHQDHCNYDAPVAVCIVFAHLYTLALAPML